MGTQSLTQYNEICKMTPRRRGRIQIFLTCLLLITVVLVLHRILSNSYAIWPKQLTVNEKSVNDDFYVNDHSGKSSERWDYTPLSQPFLGEKLVHLDLKGAPPTISYLKQFIPFIKNLGATGLLIEYEDMFPYRDELGDIPALNAYTLSDIREILEVAESNNLIVIPLIQTFGHFEFVLKLKSYKDLREVNKFPQVLCPSHEKVFFLLRRMIDQILEAHPNSNYIHIGCDEVFYLGKCSRCVNVMNENNWNSNHLFLNHVSNIAKYINKTYQRVRPIMWGDMINKNNERLLKKYDISNMVDLMIWKYVPEVSEYITPDLLDIYARLFKTVWIASAFKGATGANQVVTNAKYHLFNHVAWMKIVSKWKKQIHFKGIALTGWQRYDHFAELCELLPVAIPSLALNLHYLKGFDKGTHQSVLIKSLKCDSSIPLSPGDFSHVTISKCDFPGFYAYKMITKFFVLSKNFEIPFLNLKNGWFSLYNIIHQFSSPIYVQQTFDHWPVDEYLKKVKYYEEELKKALLEVFDEFTVKEWMTTHVTPLRIKLEAIYIAKETILEKNEWPRRPLLNGTDVLEKAAYEICSPGERYGCGLLLI